MIEFQSLSEPRKGMSFDSHEVYIQVFLVLAILHVTIDAIQCVISICQLAESQSSIDERLDVLEREVLRSLAGNYVPIQRRSNGTTPTPYNEKED